MQKYFGKIVDRKEIPNSIMSLIVLAKGDEREPIRFIQYGYSQRGESFVRIFLPSDETIARNTKPFGVSLTLSDLPPYYKLHATLGWLHHVAQSSRSRTVLNGPSGYHDWPWLPVGCPLNFQLENA